MSNQQDLFLLQENQYYNLCNGSGFDFTPKLFCNDYLGLFPECFLLSCALFLTVYGVVITTSETLRFPIALNPLAGLTIYTLFFTLLLLFNSPFKTGVFLSHSFIYDGAGSLFKILILSGTLLTLIISIDSLKNERISSFEYGPLILLSTSGMMFLVSAGDFMVMYLAIELQSLCFYVLAAFKRESEFSTEAGLKYFLLGAFSSGILLFGCCLVYGFTGGVAFSEHQELYSCGDIEGLRPFDVYLGEPTGNGIVNERLFSTFPQSGTWRGCELGMVFIMIGLLFKLSAVPFHMWAPDVYEGSPTAVTAYFAIVGKAAFILIFWRFLFTGFFGAGGGWQTGISLSAIASMLVGSFAGLAQGRIKRLLAWSAIAHGGYLLISLSSNTLEGVVAGSVYTVIYMIVSLSIFCVVLAPIKPPSQKEKKPKYLSDWSLLGKSNPLLAGSLTLSMFSLAGIPPLAGFYGKAYLFWAALNSSGYVIALVAITTSAVSAFYYIRIVKIMYFEKAVEFGERKSVRKESGLILGFCFIFNICFLAYPKPLYLAALQIGLSFL